MIRIGLLILLAATMLVGYSEANSDFDIEVQSLFYKLTTQELAFLAEVGNKGNHQDILEPQTNWYKDLMKENSDETLKLILSKINLEYPEFTDIPDAFWKTAAEAVIKAALSRSYGEDILNYVCHETETLEGWVNSVTSSDSSSVKHSFYYTVYSAVSILWLQTLIDETDLLYKRKSAHIWLNNLRSVLENKTSEEVLTFVSNPFVSHIIDEIKWVEEYNKLPAYVPKLRWDAVSYNYNVDIKPRKSKKLGSFTITENSRLFTSDSDTYLESIGMRANATGIVTSTFDGTPFSLNDSIDLTIGRRTVSCEMVSDINDSKLQRMQREASVITIEGTVASISENMIFIKGCRIH